jgi:hypothetical protein
MSTEPRTTAQCIGNACGTALSAVRNYAVYPAGRGVRNYVAPAIGHGASALGVGLRNYVAPAIGHGASALGVGLRNYVAYPLLNRTRRCIGAACGLGAAALGSAAGRVRNASHSHGVFLASALGWARFTPGLAITRHDLDVVRGIVAAHEPHKVRTNVRIIKKEDERKPRSDDISNRKRELAEDLGRRLESYIIDNDIDPTVDAYKAIATNDLFSGAIKGLYLLNIAQISRPVEEKKLSIPTATHIAMQAKEIGDANDIEYNNFAQEDLAPALVALQGQGEAHFHTRGGRGKNHKNSHKNKTRKQTKQSH